MVHQLRFYHRRLSLYIFTDFYSYASLDKIAPGIANDDTLLYGVEVKFYNMEVKLDNNLETACKSLFVIADGSGVTHSLSHASASGVYVARHICNNNQ